MRVDPQPGKRYKIVWVDGSGQRFEKEFLLVSVAGGKYEVEVDGTIKKVGYLSQLCHPWAGEIHAV